MTDERMLRKLKSMHSGEPFTPQRTNIAAMSGNSLELPNHSGDFSRGRVRVTPTTDLEIANKKYVDDSVGGDHTISSVSTLTNKTIALGSNTVSGTTAEFNTANTNGTFVITGGAFHDGFSDFVAAEHVDWAGSSAGTIHITNFAALQNTVEDTSPELGGELDAGAHTIGFTQQSATGDGSTTIDWKLGNKFFFTFGSQSDTFTFTAPTNPCSILLVLKQDSTGSREATWPAAVKWPGGTDPTLSTGGNKIDIVSFYFDGTNYYGVDSLDFS